MKSAFPQLKSAVSITLYENVPFDNTYKNHTIISTLFTYNDTELYSGNSSLGEPRERFLNRRSLATGNPYYYPRWTKTDTFNFDYANGLVTSCTLELTPEQTNANYMKVVCGSDNYYYFITGIRQLNYDTYTLSLELDVIMTYQDEFLSGIEGKPVFTTRKHCHRYTDDGLMPFCADFKTGEDTFNGIKPSIVAQEHALTFKDTQLKKIKDIMWLYICVDRGNTGFIYSSNDRPFPLTMLCIPLIMGSTTTPKIIYKKSDDTFIKTTTSNISSTIAMMLVGNGSVHGAKISPYAPFTNGSDVTITKDNVTGDITFAFNNVTENTDTSGSYYRVKVGNNEIEYANITNYDGQEINKLVDAGCLIINSQKDFTFEHEPNNSATFISFKNSAKPNITSDRYTDPKLLFSPFRKYVLSAQYTSEGCEFYPELIFSELVTSSSTNYLNLETISTSYIGDSSFYTYFKQVSVTKDNNTYYAFENYKYQKIGLACSVNYVFPCGTNALDVFNSTQAQTFYQSKFASGITSGLSIVGGIATAGIGIATEQPMLIAGGIGATAGGIAGLTNTIKSSNAKIEDLQNTPDTINTIGSNFVTDNAVLPFTYSQPFIVVYDVSSVIKEKANDFFYNNGYQVARECYFNIELSYVSECQKLDNNIFGRAIFNYVQTNEDITNKINAEIPLIVKQKLSKIFNDGITIWNFFTLPSLWGVTDVPDTTYNPDKWLFKHDLDNTELSLVLS